MKSLYLHIPFCDHKCDYCSFSVIPTHNLSDKENIISQYLTALHKEIDRYAAQFPKEQIRTICFWGGTPTAIGVPALTALVDHIAKVFDIEYLEELSIETNPDPEEVVFELINDRNTRYKSIPRIRYSIGIQSFDNEVLADSGRQYNFLMLKDFLRALVPLKKDNVVFNFDFMAFGKFRELKSGQKVLRDEGKRSFFQHFVESGFADSLSVYNLELFEGSKWYHDLISDHSHDKHGFWLRKYGDDDAVYDEFLQLVSVIEDAGYKRYELSNFAFPGKSSIHNRVYRTMQPYLGLGLSASGFLRPEDTKPESRNWPQDTGIRRTNTKKIKEYLAGNFVDERTEIASKDFAIEACFLALRTDAGVMLTDETTALFVPHRKKLLQQWQESDLCVYDDTKLVLTDEGMDKYNSLITDLLKEI